MDWYYYLIIVLGVVLLFFAVLIIRAATFKPKSAEKKTGLSVDVDEKLLAERLAELIRCKTVSYKEKELEDEAEFNKLTEKIKTMYPSVHATCELQKLSDRSLLYRWKGENSDSCTILMAHYDVVPVEAASWEKPPFDGIMENGVLWGRGTLDTKTTFFGILESAEALIKQGFKPKKDIYFSFAGNEETSGYGTPANVEYFKKNNIKIDMVLDEGGAVVENVFPGVKKPCALIGTAEKGKMEVHFTVASRGGHASTPPRHTPVGELSMAVTKVENHTFSAYYGGAAGEMFDTLARHSNFGIKLVFANLWCFKPLLSVLTRKLGGELNALVRTTVAFTMMKGSAVCNVIPPTADVGADFRIALNSNVDATIAEIKEVIDNPNVKISTLEAADPSPVSTLNCNGYSALTDAIAETWSDAVISPYLMIACSDSKHYSWISDKVYRFSAMKLSSEERKMIHGHNERIPFKTIASTVVFYTRLIQKI